MAALGQKVDSGREASAFPRPLVEPHECLGTHLPRFIKKRGVPHRPVQLTHPKVSARVTSNHETEISLKGFTLLFSWKI